MIFKTPAGLAALWGDVRLLGRSLTYRATASCTALDRNIWESSEGATPLLRKFANILDSWASVEFWIMTRGDIQTIGFEVISSRLRFKLVVISRIYIESKP